MRRTKIRKRNKLLLKTIDKQALKLIYISAILLILFIIIGLFFIKNIFIKRNFEKDTTNFSLLNESIPFSLNKIILFSSATANAVDVNQAITSLDISQYCDIGIYLNNSDKQNAIIKSLSINNINISSLELGTPCLYKKRIPDLGKCTFAEENIIQDSFNFNVINSKSEINYDNYEIYNDSTTPISLGFYNKNIKQNFLTDNNKIIYNGTLLKTASITKTSLKCNISFQINIITTSDMEYTCNVHFEIPFEDENLSIYTNGYFTKEINESETYKFIRKK